jgi:hypothetical protein
MFTFLHLETHEIEIKQKACPKQSKINGYFANLLVSYTKLMKYF